MNRPSGGAQREPGERLRCGLGICGGAQEKGPEDGAECLGTLGSPALPTPHQRIMPLASRALKSCELGVHCAPGAPPSPRDGPVPGPARVPRRIMQSAAQIRMVAAALSAIAEEQEREITMREPQSQAAPPAAHPAAPATPAAAPQAAPHTAPPGGTPAAPPAKACPKQVPVKAHGMWGPERLLQLLRGKVLGEHPLRFYAVGSVYIPVVANSAKRKPASLADVFESDTASFEIRKFGRNNWRVGATGLTDESSHKLQGLDVGLLRRPMQERVKPAAAADATAGANAPAAKSGSSSWDKKAAGGSAWWPSSSSWGHWNPTWKKWAGWYGDYSEWPQPDWKRHARRDEDDETWTQSWKR